ncbi:MAG: CsbD family protein [Chloroflexota bacterium]
MGNEEQNEGRLEQARGTVKEAIGDATDNERMQREGEWDKAKGNIREGVGDLREGAEDVAEDLKD